MTERQRKTWRGHRSWPEEDLRLLRLAYAEWPPRFDLVPPEHSRQQIFTQAYRMGLTGGRTVEPLLRDVSTLDWVYLAGFFDGEGTAYINRGVRRSTREAYAQAVVHVCNTDLAVMEWIMERFPGGSWGERAPGNDRNKVLYTYRWTRKALIREVLEGMFPYLRVKREVATHVLSAVRVLHAHDLRVVGE